MNGNARRVIISALAFIALGGCAVYAPPNEGYAYYPSEPAYVAPAPGYVAPSVYIAPPPLFFNFRGGYHRGGWGHRRGWGHGGGWRR